MNTWAAHGYTVGTLCKPIELVGCELLWTMFVFTCIYQPLFVPFFLDQLVTGVIGCEGPFKIATVVTYIYLLYTI